MEHTTWPYAIIYIIDMNMHDPHIIELIRLFEGNHDHTRCSAR